MTMAAAHGMHSIAMPLIGSGLAGWPAKLAAQVHVEQVLQYFKASTAACSLKVLGKSYACVLIFSSGHAARLLKVPTVLSVYPSSLLPNPLIIIMPPCASSVHYAVALGLLYIA